MNIEEKLEESKINISAQLEKIGISAGELLFLDEIRNKPLLFKDLSIILMNAFKIYISTQDLEEYLLTDETEIVESEKKYFANFFEYRREIVRIDSFINIELEKHYTKFKTQIGEEKYNTLINASNCLIQRLEELFKVEIAIKMERANNDYTNI